MLIPTALMNPTRTAFETNLSTPPRRSSPAATMTSPVSTESVASARDGSELSCTAVVSATMIAIAPVPCTAMNVDDVVRAPATVPTM